MEAQIQQFQQFAESTQQLIVETRLREANHQKSIEELGIQQQRSIDAFWRKTDCQFEELKAMMSSMRSMIQGIRTNQGIPQENNQHSTEELNSYQEGECKSSYQELGSYQEELGSNELNAPKVFDELSKSYSDFGVSSIHGVNSATTQRNIEQPMENLKFEEWDRNILGKSPDDTKKLREESEASEQVTNSFEDSVETLQEDEEQPIGELTHRVISEMVLQESHISQEIAGELNNKPPDSSFEHSTSTWDCRRVFNGMSSEETARNTLGKPPEETGDSSSIDKRHGIVNWSTTMTYSSNTGMNRISKLSFPIFECNKSRNWVKDCSVVCGIKKNQKLESVVIGDDKGSEVCLQRNLMRDLVIVCGSFDAYQVFDEMPLRDSNISNSRIQRSQMFMGNWVMEQHVFDPGITMRAREKQNFDFGGTKNLSFQAVDDSFSKENSDWHLLIFLENKGSRNGIVCAEVFNGLRANKDPQLLPFDRGKLGEKVLIQSSICETNIESADVIYASNWIEKTIDFFVIGVLTDSSSTTVDNIIFVFDPGGDLGPGNLCVRSSFVATLTACYWAISGLNFVFDPGILEQGGYDIVLPGAWSRCEEPETSCKLMVVVEIVWGKQVTANYVRDFMQISARTSEEIDELYSALVLETNAWGMDIRIDLVQSGLSMAIIEHSVIMFPFDPGGMSHIWSLHQQIAIGLDHAYHCSRPEDESPASILFS